MQTSVVPPMLAASTYTADVKQPNIPRAEYTRGTVSPTTIRSISYRWHAWLLCCLLITAVPLVGVTIPLSIFAREIFGEINIDYLAFAIVLLYIELSLPFLLLIVYVFPHFFAFNSLFSSRAKRHRSHWSFMSSRRLRRLVRANTYSIFVRGVRGGTTTFLVDPTMKLADLEQQLVERKYVHEDFWKGHHSFFIKPGHLLPLPSMKTMQDIGMEAGSHLELRIRRLGGAEGPPDSSSPGPTEYSDMHEPDSDPAKAQRRTAKRKIIEDEDSGSDGDFINDDDSSGTDDEPEVIVIDNAEIADILPTKLPKSKGKRRAEPQPKKKKRKTSAARVKASASAADARGSSSGVIVGAGAASGADTAGGSAPSRPARFRNPIYLFFEKVPLNAHGEPGEAGSTHWRFCHGNRKVHTITKGMKGNNSGLVGQLKHFPNLFTLYQHLQKRSAHEGVTEEERNLASGKIPMTAEIAAKYGAKLDQNQGSIKQAFQRQQAAQQEPWDDKVFDNLIARWVVACDQPFDEVEKPEFIDMINYAKDHQPPPGYTIPGRFTIKRRAMQMGKDTVAETLESKVAISLDAWTSSNGYAFLAIIAHYVTNDGRLEELLIDFHELIGAHTGENMAQAVWATLGKYGLKGRISAFVMDNATNNDTLVEAIEDLCATHGITFSAKQSRLRCMPHTIHLSAIKLLEAIGAISKAEADKASSKDVNYQDSVTRPMRRKGNTSKVSLKSKPTIAEDEDDDSDLEDASVDTGTNTQDVSSAVGKLRSIVKAIRSSPQRRQAWPTEVQFARMSGASAQSPQDMQILMLILDVKTRWSSTHEMLRRALRYQAAIDGYVRHHPELSKYELSETDWKAINMVSGWLCAFREATVNMSTTSRPMLSEVHSTFRALQLHVKDALTDLAHDASPELRQGLIDAHAKLAEYYAKFDESYLCIWACLLDPRISYDGLKNDYQDEPDLLNYLEDAKIKLREHYTKEYASKASSSDSRGPHTSGHPTTPSLADAEADHAPRMLNIGERYRRTAIILDELDEYYKMPPPADFKTCDPLEWWRGQRSRFPKLYRLACDVLCIPGSAVAVERVFSGGRDTISLRRARLAPDTIRTLMLVKHKLRLERKLLDEQDGGQGL